MSFGVPIAFFDPPVVLDATVTPIPKASDPPLQVIADTGNNSAIGIHANDSTGAIIGVYIGASGHETLACFIGNGHNGLSYGRFPRNSRVSLRSMTTSAISNGLLSGALVAT